MSYINVATPMIIDNYDREFFPLESNEESDNIPYATVADVQSYVCSSKSSSVNTNSPVDLKMVIRQLYRINCDLKNIAVIHPYGYNINKTYVSHIRHFPQLLFGQYVGSHNYLSLMFEIVIKINTQNIKNLSVKLISNEGHAIISYKNCISWTTTRGLIIKVEKELHDLHNAKSQQLINTKTYLLKENAQFIVNHKKKLMISFNDNDHNYIIHVPVFCFPSNGFRLTFDKYVSNVPDILELHQVILHYLRKETFFQTSPIKKPDRSSINIPQICAAKVPSVGIIPTKTTKSLDSWGDSFKRTKKVNTLMVDLTESNTGDNIEFNIFTTRLFTRHFKYDNIKKLIESEYYSGCVNGLSLLKKIKSNKKSGAIIISKTQMSDFVCWIIEILENGKCVIGFFEFSSLYKYVFVNIFNKKSHPNPFFQIENEIIIDYSLHVHFDTLISNWIEKGIKPIFLV